MDKKILTLPNILSFIRIGIIPFIILAYFKLKYTLCFFLIALSGITDLVDGFIARKFNQISDFGKILDPIADKLTQVAVLLMLFIDFLNLWPVWVLLFILFFKELATLILAAYVLTKGATAISAKWWGKISTTSIYITVLLMVLSKAGIGFLNYTIISFMAIISSIFLIISMCGYYKIFFISKKERNNA